MSLIQEALRRKDDDENGRKLTPPPRVIPSLYDNDVPPVLKLPEKPKGGGKSWVVLVGSLIFVLALILVALGLILYSTRQMVQTAGLPPRGENGVPVLPMEATPPTPPPVKVDVVIEPAKAVEPPKVIPSGTEETVRVPAPRPAPLSSTEAAQEPPPVRSQATTREPARPRSATPVRLEATKPPASTSQRPPVITEIPRKSLEGVRTVPVAVSGTSVWPRLNLHGVMAQTMPGQGSAIINGTVVEVGERIDGARLVEVQRNGVLLEFKGNTQFVRVGQSTF